MEPPRILVVDDDEVVLDVLATALTPTYDVTTTRSATKALELVGTEEFCVLLADQRMPELHGVDLASRARALKPNMVTVLVSAYTEPQDMIAAINQGQVFRFLHKPWDNRDLLHTVKQAVEHHRLQKDNTRLLGELERRLGALGVLQEVLTASLGAQEHPGGVLLGKLAGVVPFDLAAVLLRDGDSATLEMHTRGRTSEQNVIELKDQALEMFAYFAGAPLDEAGLHVRAAVAVDAGAPARRVESQAAVPLRLESKVVGVLIVQSFTPEAFPHDAARLLDLLANGTAQALERLRVAGAESARRLESALDTLTDAVLICSHDGEARLWNRAARKLLAAASLDAPRLWEKLGVRPDQALGAPIERRAVLHDRHVVAQLTAHADSVVVCLRDVTEVVEAEAHLRDVVSNVSHELRTPLSSVIATLDILLAGMVGTLQPKQSEYLKVATDACERLNRLVDELLDSARFARQGVELLTSPADIAGVVHLVAARYEAAARERRLVIESAAVPAAMRATCDAARLEQVFGNLIANSVKFAPHGSEIRLSLAAAADAAPYAVFGVENGGEPIPPEELELIFDRFRQAKNQQAVLRQRGSGLGLAICRSIVEAHGGAVLAESDAHLTRFWVALPQQPLGAVAPRLAAAAPLWVHLPFGPLRIAVAAALLRHGLPARLLPADSAAATEARRRVGEGILVGGDGALLSAPSVAEAERLGDALARLATLRGTHVHLDGAPCPELRRLLTGLGLPLVEEPLDDAVCLGLEGATPTLSVLALAQQLETGATRHGAVRALLRRATGKPLAFGVVRLVNLEAFRAAYGARRAGQLREAVAAAAERALAPFAGATDRALIADGVVVAVPPDNVAAVVAEIEGAAKALLVLQLRRRDRDGGVLQIGETEAPLPSAVGAVCPDAAGVLQQVA